MMSVSLPPADPKAPDFIQDPYPFYDWLRENGPVFFDARNEIYFVGSHELVEEVFKDHERFSSNIDRPAMRAGGIFGDLQAIKDRDWPRKLTVTQNDDLESHDMYRALIAPFFMPKSLGAVEPFVRTRTDELFGDIEKRERCDFVAEFAVPLPISVIGRMLGLDTYGLDRMKIWSDASADQIGLLSSDVRALEAAELILQGHQCMIEAVHERRTTPKDDIISHLANARLPDGRLLEEPELVSLIQQLLVAGNETTTNMLGSGMRRMALDPALFASLKAEPRLVHSFVEELLRLESPIQGQFRRATRDTELGGVEIKAGSLLHVRLASANRDEAVFGADAGKMQLGARHPKQHLAFGVGMHFCLGAMLSRLEMRVAFTEAVTRWDSVELDVPAAELLYRPHFYHRGLQTLPLRVKVAA